MKKHMRCLSYKQDIRLPPVAYIPPGKALFYYLYAVLECDCDFGPKFA